MKKRYKMSKTETQETGKPRLTALGTRLKRYAREAEVNRINDLSSKKHSQLQGNTNTRAELKLSNTG